MPDWVRERARGLAEVADHETPIADLISDSLLDPGDVAPHTRIVRFGRPDGRGATVTTPLRPGDLDLHVEITPAQGTTVHALYSDGAILSATTDSSGQATLRSVPSGLITLYVAADTENESAWRTAWLRY